MKTKLIATFAGIGILAAAQAAHAAPRVIASNQGFSEDALLGIYKDCITGQTRDLVKTLIPDDPESPLSEYNHYTDSGYTKPLIGTDQLWIEEGYQMKESCTNWPEPEMKTELAFRTGRLRIESFYNDYACIVDGGIRHFTRDIATVRQLRIPYYKYKTETQVEESTDDLGRVTRTKIEVIKPDSLALMVYDGPAKLGFDNDHSGRPLLDTDTHAPLTFDVAAYKSCLKNGVSAELARSKPVAKPGTQPRGAPAEADGRDAKAAHGSEVAAASPVGQETSTTQVR